MTILRKVKIASSSDARRKYMVTLFANGSGICSCPASIYKMGGTRNCKHVRAAKGGAR